MTYPASIILNKDHAQKWKDYFRGINLVIQLDKKSKMT